MGWCIVVPVLFVLPAGAAGASATPRSEPINSSIDAGRQQYPVAVTPTFVAAFTNLAFLHAETASNLDDDLRQTTTVSQKIPSQAGLADPSAMSTRNRRVWQRALQVTGVGMAYPTL